MIASASSSTRPVSPPLALDKGMPRPPGKELQEHSVAILRLSPTRYH